MLNFELAKMQSILNNRFLLPFLSSIWIIMVGWHEFSLFDSNLGIYWKEGQLLIRSGSEVLPALFSNDISLGHWMGSLFIFIFESEFSLNLLQFLAIASTVTICTAIQFRCYKKNGNQFYVFLLTLISIPLLLNNYAISHHFLLPVLALIMIYCNLKIKKFATQLVLISLIQIIWVNWHESSFLGIIMVMALAGFSSKPMSQKLLLITTALVTALCTPFHVGVFRNYLDWCSTMINNHQLPDVISNHGSMVNWLAYFHICIAVISIILVIYNLINYRKNGGLNLVYICLSVVGVLHIELSGLNAIVLLLVGIEVCANFQQKTSKLWTSYKSPILMIALSIPLLFSTSVLFPFSSNWKLGIDSPSDNCLSFLQRKRILNSPAFHNTGMGSIIAFADYKKMNPLCSPHPNYNGKQFTVSTLIPCYEDFSSWIKVKNDLLPNLIVFRLKGASETSLDFLDGRLKDGEWTMVYFDPLEAAILIRNLSENNELIGSLRVTE
ncbi:MAG: hypothetical protein ACI9J3_000771 [Parvicellaceae bacterium]|jgi:hypothetical protein